MGARRREAGTTYLHLILGAVLTHRELCPTSSYRQETEVGRIKSPVQDTMVPGRAGAQVCLIPKSELPSLNCSPSGPSPTSVGLAHTQEACLHLGLPLLQEGPKDRGGGDACRYGAAHLPITSAGDSPSSQVAKLRPRLQASGKLPGGQSGWPGLGSPNSLDQPEATLISTSAAHHLECPPDSGIWL